MRGWFRSLGVGTKRNNRPLPKRLLLALSGPRPQHGGTSDIWLMRTCVPLKPLWAAESILGGCRPPIWTYFRASRS